MEEQIRQRDFNAKENLKMKENKQKLLEKRNKTN